MNFLAHYKLSDLTVIVVCLSNSNTENILTDIFHSWGEQVSHLCGTAQGFYSLIVPHMETVPPLRLAMHFSGICMFFVQDCEEIWHGCRHMDVFNANKVLFNLSVLLNVCTIACNHNFRRHRCESRIVPEGSLEGPFFHMGTTSWIIIVICCCFLHIFSSLFTFGHIL